MAEESKRETNPAIARCVLTSAAIATLPGKEKVHFLNDNARRNNKSLGDATGLTGFGIHLIEIPPGADSTEFHVHQFEDEGVYILEGRAVATLDNETFELNAGDFVGLPRGGPAHVFHNPGPGKLTCLVVGERLSHDVCDYPKLGKRLYRNADAWALVEIDNIVDPKSTKGLSVGSK